MMLEGVQVDANTWITVGSALSIVGAAVKFTRETTRMKVSIEELRRTSVRKSAMDLWIARTEKILGQTLPPFPRQEEERDDDNS